LKNSEARTQLLTPPSCTYPVGYQRYGIPRKHPWIPRLEAPSLHPSTGSQLREPHGPACRQPFLARWIGSELARGRFREQAYSAGTTPRPTGGVACDSVSPACLLVRRNRSQGGDINECLDSTRSCASPSTLSVRICTSERVEVICQNPSSRTAM
jgi:hypothetical protein